MEHEAASGLNLVAVVALLGAAVIAVPVFRRLRLGSVLGYLAAGLAMGPFGLGVVQDAETILHTAELGVVLFLFLIGLEMEPARLWSMRRDIFGLGASQVLLCLALLSTVGLALGFPAATSLVAGAGFVLTSTAIVMQILAERGDVSRPKGQRIVSILLFEDLAIVPLLALVAFLAPGGGEPITLTDRLLGAAIGIGSIVVLIVGGRFLLNPLFKILARYGGREMMTAGALLVVLGSALLLQSGGLSTAMGAFLAGVLLSESTFRHELEADVEPFRGLLLGLFFLAVGMTLDLGIVVEEWRIVVTSVVAYVVLKALGIYTAARVFRSSNREALHRVAIMAHGGEFAFVLYASALAVGLIDARGSAMLTATIILSMAIMPLMVMLLDRLPKPVSTAQGETPEDLRGDVLLIGFGRFGQIVSQPLLARGWSVSIIDRDTDMIEVAGYLGFKVYFGDATRLDILHAAGAGRATCVLICIDDQEASSRIATILKSEFPLAPIFARAYDRAHALQLIRLGVDYQLRETVESALAFSRHTLDHLGETAEVIDEVMEEVRARDEDRLGQQVTGDITSGRDLLRSNLPDHLRDAARAAPPPRSTGRYRTLADGTTGAPVASSG